MVTKNQTAKAEKNSQTTSLLDQVMEQTRFKPEMKITALRSVNCRIYF